MILQHHKTLKEVQMRDTTASELLVGALAYGWEPRGDVYFWTGSVWGSEDCMALRAALVRLWPGALTWRVRSNDEFRVITRAPRSDRRLSADAPGSWDRSDLIAESVGAGWLVELALLVHLLGDPGSVRVVAEAANPAQGAPLVRGALLPCPVRFVVGVQLVIGTNERGLPDRQHFDATSGIVELHPDMAREVVNTGRAVPTIEPLPVSKKRGAAA